MDHEAKSNPAQASSEDGVLTTPDGHAIPRVLDAKVTMDLVQRYVQTERARSRRILIFTSMTFLAVVLVILVVFMMIGIHVLKNSRKAAEIAAELHAQTIGYAVEVVGISNKIDQIAAGAEQQVKTAVGSIEKKREKESRVLKSDLERFSRWVSDKNSADRRAIATVEARLKDMEAGAAAKEKELAAVKEQYSLLLARVGDSPTVQRSAAQSAAAAPVASGADDAPDNGMEPSVKAAQPQDVEEEAAPVQPPAASEISVVSFPNGDRYEGEFKSGLMSGWGSYYFQNGDRYEGEFKNDMKEGKGTLNCSNGDRYIGEYKRDAKNGRGSLVTAAGDKYAGEFRDDAVSGKGTMIYHNGNKYAGDFARGMKHGNGIFNFVNGDVYEGEFKEDQRNGRGTYTFTDGTKYIGEFNNGQRHGLGRYIYAGGEEYAGEFKSGKKDGKGVCIYPNGTRLSGLWKEDKLLKVTD